MITRDIQEELAYLRADIALIKQQLIDLKPLLANQQAAIDKAANWIKNLEDGVRELNNESKVN